MSEHLRVLALALLPAFGNISGALIAEVVPASPRVLNRALHTAAGIVLAVVAVELMPEALAGSVQAWIIAAAFLLGGCFYLTVEWLLERLQGDASKAGGRTGIWMIYAAVSVDLFSDGLMIGTGSAVSFSLALILAAGQILADIPEGFAALAKFKEKGVPRAKRLLLSASLTAPVLLAASAGYWLLRGQSETLKLSALVFTAGVLAVAAVEQMITQAHESKPDSRWSVLAFSGGFALFVLVSSYFERG